MYVFIAAAKLYPILPLKRETVIQEERKKYVKNVQRNEERRREVI